MKLPLFQPMAGIAPGAAAFGLRVIHVNRFNQADERLGVSPEAHVASLAEAAALIAQMLK